MEHEAGIDRARRIEKNTYHQGKGQAGKQPTKNGPAVGKAKGGGHPKTKRGSV